MKQSDRDVLGKYLSEQIKNKRSAEVISERLIFQAKDFLNFISNNENTVATQKLYNEFWKRLCVYYKAHINVKYVVDYLKPNDLKKYLSILQKARLAAEPVLNRTEEFMETFAGLLSKKIKCDRKSILCLTKFEIENYFTKGKLPKKSTLEQRYKKSALLHDKKSSGVFGGTNVNKIEKLVHQPQDTNQLKGATAFSGKVTGIVKIITNPQKNKNFKKGEILVTGATRPEFLPIMLKAAAFITDAGGILSHAAITARELKKPCIIGTKIATKVFKDGDLVEVDANKGVVRKIK